MSLYEEDKLFIEEQVTRITDKIEDLIQVYIAGVFAHEWSRREDDISDDKVDYSMYNGYMAGLVERRDNPGYFCTETAESLMEQQTRETINYLFGGDDESGDGIIFDGGEEQGHHGKD